ncbi:SusC/RagA family TonB-linked outer membrane protein [Bacteroidia bacterium]|nr:SusC/RagA family TonB-linked outer membrane protein [Bacteroidia bacterium]
MVIFLLTIGNVAYSQKVTLDFRQERLEKVLEAISKQTGKSFSYSRPVINPDAKVSISVKDEELHSVLTQIIDTGSVEIEITGKKIFLKPLQARVSPASANATQQKKTVTGVVTDQNGEAVIGASVVEKGTANGSITDVNGSFTLNVQENATLLVSFIGYATQETRIGSQSNLNILLTEDNLALEEVVVIGYGTQKKVNLTGSVSALTSKDIQSLRVTQPSQLLAGLASGLTVIQGSGQPGNDAATLRIRGMGTFSSAGNDPLVLIDGISSNLNHINVSDIENISVLKDAASASIYGTRAANGVILVETKKGKEGVSRITYQGNVGFQRAAEVPRIVDSWVYAEMINEALRNNGSNMQYTEAEIAKFKSGEDLDNYPNKRHLGDLLSSGSGLLNDHYLSFTGGNTKNSYLFSVGYMNQQGVIAETNHEHYNVLLNVNSQIKDNFKVNIKFSGRTGQTAEPNPGASSLFDYGLKIPHTIAGKKSDGYYGQQTGYSIEGWMDSESFIKNSSNRAIASAGFDWEIIKSLKFSGLAGYDYSNVNSKTFWPVIVMDQSYTQSPSSLRQNKSESSLLTLQALLNYDKTIHAHEVHLLGGFSQESYRDGWAEAFRDNFPSNTLYEINAGAPSNQQNGGSGTEWGLRSFFGRVNYVFDGKYLFEANARYDGSSRFPSSKRWGLFPSVSGGWIISQENFFHADKINHLKLRASWGTLGNQNIGNYPYQQVLRLGIDAPFGVSEQMSSGAAATVVPSVDITWESTRVVDAGLDIGLFNNKLNLSLDYYDKLTSDILYYVTASTVLGMTPSVQNAGIVSNKGIDLSLQHRNTMGDFSYNITANFSYVKNEVKELATVLQDVNAGLFVGHSLQSLYGFITEGLFVDQADVDNYAAQPRAAKPGDIKLKDISGPNGVPDGIVNADYDRQIIGNQFPKYNFGLTLTPRYKNFDLSVNMYGVAGYNKILGGYANQAFYQGSSPQQWMVDGRWTEQNPNPNAAYPRFLILGGGEQQFYTSTFFMQDASFLRISNIQLGYNVPAKLLEKYTIANLYVYLGVKNPVTFDHFREGWDPEIGYGYPPMRSFNAGVNINF